MLSEGEEERLAHQQAVSLAILAAVCDHEAGIIHCGRGGANGWVDRQAGRQAGGGGGAP